MNHQTRVYDSVLELLPSEENPSPLVRINRLNPAQRAGFSLLAKLEWMNPFGSVKDRAAWQLISDLESRGQLGDSRPGRGIVEPTSGNTGLSLAGIAAVRGYPMRAVVPGKVPAEKRMLLKLMGAQLDVTNDAMCPLPGAEDGTIGLARTHAKASPDKYVMPNQYENRQNVEAHIRTTGPEIWRQTEGKVTHVFTSLGTCGTVTGLATFLKGKNPKIKVIAVQPSPGHDVPGIRNTSELDVSKLYDPKLIDEIVEVPFELAYTRVAELCRREGLMAGPSSGLIFEGASRVLRRELDAGAIGANTSVPAGVGVMIFCDSVLKYASSMLKHLPELADPTENP
jgi:cysteine synthase A/cysteine synthase B